MHPASGKPTKAPRAGLLGGDCGRGPAEGPGPGEGPGPAEGGRGASRSIFASCSVTRASCSSARAICSWTRANCSSARATRATAFNCSGRGVHWRFLFPSNVIRRWWSTLHQVDQPPTLRAVLPKEWPYDGKVWDPMAIASWNPGGPLRCSRAARQLSSLVGRRRMRFCGPGQVA